MLIGHLRPRNAQSRPPRQAALTLQRWSIPHGSAANPVEGARCRVPTRLGGRSGGRRPEVLAEGVGSDPTAGDLDLGIVRIADTPRWATIAGSRDWQAVRFCGGRARPGWVWVQSTRTLLAGRSLARLYHVLVREDGHGRGGLVCSDETSPLRLAETIRK
ncbi:hypothetical protein FMEAI12_4250004 [Parafrankia sp. Ea1.12]|nr:hypothetical protein FMEAI12_4250004 [Parafrankia sp. Ea1.12]